MSWTKVISGAAILILSLTISSHADAVPPSVPFEYLKDPCGYPFAPAEHVPKINRLSAATALLVPKSQMELRPDNPNYYRFKNYSSDGTWSDTGVQAVGDWPFINDIRYSTRGRTGFLAGPNVIVTASHSPQPPGNPANFNPDNFYVVFDVRSIKNATNVCEAAFSPEYVPIDKVFKAKPFAAPPAGPALIVDTMLEYREPTTYGDDDTYASIDYAAFYLDRPVSSTRKYLRIRLNGEPSDGDTFANVGHPQYLSQKMTYGLTFMGMSNSTNAMHSHKPLFDDHYLTGGGLVAHTTIWKEIMLRLCRAPHQISACGLIIHSGHPTVPRTM